MATHNLSRATGAISMGDVYYERYHRQDTSDIKAGLPADVPIWVDFGAPLTLQAAGLLSVATGAELPNASTITYTTANDAVSPIDDANRPAVASVVMADGTTQSVWVFPTPRNITGTTTHGSSIVAMTIQVNGYDVYGEAMTELTSVTATGTSKTNASLGTALKAFKYIKSIVLIAAGNATANSLSLGFGDTLGLPFRVDNENKVLPIGNKAVDASATVIKADDTNPQTSATGDPRGTVKFNTATDGAKKFAAWLIAVDRTANGSAAQRNAANAFGNTPV